MVTQLYHLSGPQLQVSDALTFNPWITAIHSRNYVVTASDSKGCIGHRHNTYRSS